MNIDRMLYTDRIRYIAVLEYIRKTNVNDMAKYDNQVQDYVLGLGTPYTSEPKKALEELKDNIKKTFADLRNKFSHILHKNPDIAEGVLKYAFFYARSIDDKITEQDIHNNKTFTTKGLLFFISLRSSKATMSKLLDSIENGKYKTEKKFYTYYAISRDKGHNDISHWTLYCNIMDYLRKPMQNTARVEEKTKCDIRPINKYAFDVFCLQYLSLIKDNPVEFARSISTHCEKKKKWIKRPYFSDMATEALQTLNTYRRTENDTNNDLEYEDCEIYRNPGDCYIVRLENKDPILIQRRFLQELLVSILTANIAPNKTIKTIKGKFTNLYNQLNGIESDSDGKYNIHLPKSRRTNIKELDQKKIEDQHQSYKNLFKARTIISKDHHEQVRFILWSLQHPISKKEALNICLNKTEYQQLFQELIATVDVKKTIKRYLEDNTSVEFNKIGDYFKETVSKTISKGLCFKFNKWIDGNEPEYKKFLKIKDENTPNHTPAQQNIPEKNKKYVQPNTIVLGKLEDNNRERYQSSIKILYEKVILNHGSLISDNYSYRDIDITQTNNELNKTFSKEDLKCYFKNKSTFQTDQVLLALGEICFDNYKKQNEITVEIYNTHNTIEKNTIRIEGEIFRISHLGKPYMHSKDLKNIIKQAQDKKNTDTSKCKSDRTIISYMEQVLSKSKRTWHRFGEAILEIENAVVDKWDLTLPDNENCMDFIEISKHLGLSSENTATIKKIRNICFHINISERNGIINDMTNDDIVDFLNPIRSNLSLPPLKQMLI